MNALGVARHIHLLAQFTLGTVGDEWGVARIVECENPTLFASFLCRLSGSLAGGLRQAIELCLIGDVQFVGLVFLQEVLRELQGKDAGLF